MKCPNCGYFNLPGATVCGQCRRALDETASAATSPVTPISEVMPPRAKNRSVGGHIEARSPAARRARRFALHDWSRTQSDILNTRTELWNWKLALHWWLPPVLSVVPGLGQLLQRRILQGLIFFCATLLAVVTGVLFLHNPISNWLFAAALFLVGASIFDAANESFPPATPEARRWRTLRLGFLSTLFVMMGVLGAIGILQLRYGLWNMVGDQAAPLFLPSDGLIVQRFETDEPIRELRHGDIVITNAYGTIVERVLGLPGDHVAYQDKKLLVNGKTVSKKQLPLAFREDQTNFEIRVPLSQLLVWVGVPNAPPGAEEFDPGVEPYLLVSENLIQGRVIGLYNPAERRQWLK